jgi:hypothetical protein
MKKTTLLLSILMIAFALQINAQTKRTGPVKAGKTVVAKPKKQSPASVTSATQPVAGNKTGPKPVKKITEVNTDDQHYKTAVGIKFLYGISLTGKFFLKEKNAVEAIIRYRNYTDLGTEFNLTALYEHHENVSGASGLRWYIGGGGHVGTFSYKYDGAGPTTTYGIAGAIGLEYKIKGVPLAVSADWQPLFLLSDNAGFTAENGGIGLKYTF